MQPQILAPDYGKHNQLLDESIRRIEKSGVYKDLSTIILVPSLGTISAKCVASWWNLITPPNQKCFRLWPLGMEVGEAYSTCVANILAHPDLSKFRYILTLEADNAPEPDGLVKLLTTAESRPEFSAVGGLYWTKGPEGVPQIWGDPRDPYTNFRPLPPRIGEVIECCGVAQGFTLFRLDMFKDNRLRRPWFKTLASTEGVGTQDLYFWGDARKYGYRCAIDCSVLVGHHDYAGSFGPPDTMW